MKPIALLCNESQEFSLQNVILPEIQDDQVLIRTAYSGVSIGTEFALIRKKISWGPYPLVTGYMATGTVEAAGKAVTDLKPGDRVYTRGNMPFKLEDGTPVSSVYGTHASHIINVVGGTHGTTRLPDAADMRTSCMFVLPAVGYLGVDMAQPRLEDTVVVFGCGLIGLGVVAACALRGCRVVAVDMQPRQLEMARQFGADEAILSGEGLAHDIESLCPGGADVVFECTGIPALVDTAISLCRVEGKFVWQGNYGEKPISFSFLVPHVKKLQTFFPCDDGYTSFRAAVIKHMTRGVLPWEKTLTHHIAAEDAPGMYARINAGAPEVVGVTLRWS